MRQKKDFSDLFDDDFEVVYEDDYTKDYREYPEDRYERNYSRKYDSDDEDSWRDEDDSEQYRRDAQKQRKSSGRRNSRGVPLAAPIRKGGRVLSRAASALVRCLTAVLILATAVYVTYTFWRASTPYGDIAEAIRTRQLSMTLAAYLCVAAIFPLFEFIALLWSMTRVRVRDQFGSWKEDTGRGLVSFILVFATSYLSFLLSRFLPESPQVLYGIKGALDVYGSMYNVLLGFCTAGVLSCLVRKYFSR